MNGKWTSAEAAAEHSTRSRLRPCFAHLVNGGFTVSHGPPKNLLCLLAVELALTGADEGETRRVMMQCLTNSTAPAARTKAARDEVPKLAHWAMSAQRYPPKCRTLQQYGICVPGCDYDTADGRRRFENKRRAEWIAEHATELEAARRYLACKGPRLLRVFDFLLRRAAEWDLPATARVYVSARALAKGAGITDESKVKSESAPVLALRAASAVERLGLLRVFRTGRPAAPGRGRRAHGYQIVPPFCWPGDIECGR